MSNESKCVACGSGFLLEDAAECPWCLASRAAGSSDAGPSRTEICEVDPTRVPVEAMERQESDRFGQYIRISKLGRGGMGEVWKAWDTQLNRWVALKFLTEADAHGLMLFQTEAQLTANLSHPNIAAIHDYGKARGLYYIAMQLVDGRPLDKAGRLETRRAAGLVMIAARAVHFAHGQGILHRDVKPANLMVTDTGHLYVMDFGLAARAGAERDPDFWKAGTEPFASPQQTLGRAPDVRDDIYSLGVTLRALLPRKVPAAIRRIIAKSTAQTPAARYDTAEAFARDLELYLRPRLRGWMAVAAAAALVLGVGGMFAASHVGNENKRRVEQAEVWSWKAEQLLNSGDFQGAIAAYDQALALRPTVRSHLSRSFCNAELGNLEASLEDCRRAFALDPTSGPAQRTLARAEQELRESREP